MKPQNVAKMQDELRALVSEVAEILEEEITTEAQFAEDLGVDSMMALEIVAKIEKQYKVRVPEEKIPTIRSLQNLNTMLEELL